MPFFDDRAPHLRARACGCCRSRIGAQRAGADRSPRGRRELLRPRMPETASAADRLSQGTIRQLVQPNPTRALFCLQVVTTTPLVGHPADFSTQLQNLDGEHFSKSGGDMHPGALGSREQSGGAQVWGGAGRVHPVGSGLQPLGVHVVSPLASLLAVSAQYDLVASQVAVPQFAPPDDPLVPPLVPLVPPLVPLVPPLEPLDAPLVPLDPSLEPEPHAGTTTIRPTHNRARRLSMPVPWRQPGRFIEKSSGRSALRRSPPWLFWTTWTILRPWLCPRGCPSMSAWPVPLMTSPRSYSLAPAGRTLGCSPS